MSYWRGILDEEQTNTTWQTLSNSFLYVESVLYSSKLARSKIEIIIEYILFLIKDMAHSCTEFVKDSV
jgi:hypothetical protein